MRKRILILLLTFFILLPGFLAAQSTVVCIHGFLRSYKSMRPIARSLHRTGFNICFWDYPSRKYSIHEHGEHLLTLLQKKAKENPGEPIHFVCHSLGGLILRVTLNLPGCPEEAKMGRAVLLAPPNKGSKLAQSSKNNPFAHWVLGSKAGKDLMCFTECDIINLGNFPDTMDVMVIAGTKGVNVFFEQPNDGILEVKETYLDTPFCLCKIAAGHGKIMKCPQTIELITQFLCNFRSKTKILKNQVEIDCLDFLSTTK